MKLIIDSREPKSLISFVKNKYKKKYDVSTEQLPEGDYVTDRVICERKAIGDLNSSLADGRYVAQLNRISTYKDKIHMLLVTGNVADYCKKMRFMKTKSGKRINCSQNTLLNAIAMAQYRYNFIVIMAESDKDGLQEMVAFMAGVDGGKFTIPERAKPHVLFSRLFGIPLESTKSLFKRFGSVESIIKTENNELCEIKGIGPAKAKKIKKVLTENVNE